MIDLGNELIDWLFGYYPYCSNGVYRGKCIEIWYKNGKLHREDGPAVNGPFLEKWYNNGKLHREDGPAVVRIWSNEYWLFGKKYEYSAYWKKIDMINKCIIMDWDNWK